MGYRLYLLLLLHIDFTFLQGRSKKIIIFQYFLSHRLQFRDLSLFLYNCLLAKVQVCAYDLSIKTFVLFCRPL
jgi:hypothetical protein